MLNVLLLCDKPSNSSGASTIIDHISAFENWSNHKIFVYSKIGELALGFDFSRFDVVVLHYSLYLPHLSYLSKKSREQIKAFKGLKVAFVQDEYRQINSEIDILSYLDIDVLFTCFREIEAQKIYDRVKLPNLTKYNNLTGYVPDNLLNEQNIPLIKDRTIDVGYRARKLPFWLGELSYEKWNIVEKWNLFALKDSLRSDVSYLEEDRIYGDNWLDFIKNCKAQLGVESGASVMDFTGEIERNITNHIKKNPNDDFFTVQKLFLKDVEGLYKLNQISPRCFEAIALKTVLILYEGEYSNILQPWEHYIPLKKDFSNISEVVSCLKNNDFLQELADRAYEKIALNPKYSYKTFIKGFDEILQNEFNQRKKLKAIKNYSDYEFFNLIQKKTFKEFIRLELIKSINKLPPKIRNNIIFTYRKLK